MKHLLIIYHSQNGNTQKMANAVYKGAIHPDLDIKVKLTRASDCKLDDLLWANGVIFGTPENFGYMSGALKDFFDRTYYPAEGKIEGLSYCVFISAGNDGAGALRSIQRIVKGYPLREVQEAIISKGELNADILEACENMGTYMAAGIEGGIF